MLIIADNLQITKSIVAGAMEMMDPEPIQALVRSCEQAGAQAMDINPGPLTKSPEEKVRFLVNAVQEVTDLPLVIDTSNPRAMAAGLEACTNTTIINGFSLQPDKLQYILPLAREYKCKIIGYLLTADSHVPPDVSGRFDVALELFSHLENHGVEPSQLIIDPVIVPLQWEDGQKHAAGVLEVIQTLPDLLGFPVETVAGISNLTSGPGEKHKKMMLEQSYLAMLVHAGLDMALMNIFHEESVKAIGASAILTQDAVFSWEMM